LLRGLFFYLFQQPIGEGSFFAFPLLCLYTVSFWHTTPMANSSKKLKKTQIDVNDTGKLLPVKKEPDQLCNARLRWKDGYCPRPAGEDTDHPGTGRCREHGGSSLGRPKVTFSPAEFDENAILKRLESVVEADPSSIAVVDNEITMLRSVFYRYMKVCNDQEHKLPNPSDLKKFTDALAKMLEIKSKLEHKFTPKTQIINTNVFVLYVSQINNILKKHIQDGDLLNRIADDLENLELPELNNADQQG